MPPATATPSDFDARTLLDCVDDVIIVVDDDFRFTYANSAARDFLGPIARRDDGPRRDGVARRRASRRRPARRRAVRRDRRATTHGRGTLRLRVREGDGWRPVEALLTNRRGVPGINGVVVCFRNLTQEERLRSNLETQLQLDQHNRALRNELQERQRFLSRLVRIQSSISRRAPLDDVLVAIVDGTTQLFGDTVVCLRLRDPSDPSRLVLVASHGVRDDVLPQLSIELRLRHRRAGVPGEPQRRRRELRRRVPNPTPALIDHGLRAAMAVPVRSDGVTVGSLSIGTQWPQTFSDTEREMLEILAEHAGIALLDANSRESVRLALTDQLTGLPNRRLFLDRLTQGIDQCRRSTVTRSPCCSSTSTASRRSTTGAGTRPVTACSRRSPGGSRGRSTAAIRRRGSAATSSS